LWCARNDNSSRNSGFLPRATTLSVRNDKQITDNGDGWVFGAEGLNGIGGWKVSGSFTPFRMTAKNRQPQQWIPPRSTTLRVRNDKQKTDNGDGWVFGLEGLNGIGGWKVSGSFTPFRMTAKNRQPQ
jgi:hypothetical protein